jgi:hypothetical protein
MTSKTEIQTDVKALIGLTESELEAELGRRLIQTEEELEADKPLSATHGMGQTVDQQQLQALPVFVRTAAERFLKKFNKEMRSGPGSLNRISASLSGGSAGIRLPSGGAAG